MSDQSSRPLTELVGAPFRLFLRDFAAFAGVKGLKTLVFMFLGAAVEGVGLILLIPFLSTIIESQGPDGWMHGASAWLFGLFSVQSRIAKLSLLVAFFGMLVVARVFIVTVRDVTIAGLQIGYIQQIQTRITRRLAAAQWDTISRLRHSRIMNLMGGDIAQLSSATNVLMNDLVAVIMLVSQAILAVLLAPELAVLALGVLLLGAMTLLPMVRRAHAIGSFVTNANLSLIDDMSQFLGALKLAITQNLQKSFIREFESTLGDLKAQQISYVRQQTISRLAVGSLTSLIGAIAIVLGIVIFDVSPSVMITLLLIFSRMNGPAMQLQLDAQYVAHSMPAYEKVRELEADLAAAESIAVATSDTPILLPDGPIVFRNVSFIHDTTLGEPCSRGGVRDLNLIIEPGSVIGIGGPSGAGKTTFADLLVGLYAPQSGEISIGGVALHGPAIAAWRNTVSYVSQDPFLFHDTIRRNLLWANPGADEDAIWNAIRMAGAEQIVRNARQGLDTLVGERGSLFSGGERQRLCVARAMLRRPHLLVLDEATSAIDFEGEHALLDRLLAAKPRPMIVMIAHRRESLRRCQRVCLFEGGTLISDQRGGSTSAFPISGSGLTSEFISVT
jgi:ABC-type multidrug transport system fused ATPase/permease subunit